MLSIETAAAFFSASLLLALAPGPDNLFVLTQSALHGRRAGWIVTLGLCTGLIVHTTAVAAGVAAIVQTSATAFGVLKTVGCAYLLYLAWQAFTSSSADNDADRPKAAATGQLYRRGIVMNVTNPKVSLFFLAFLPQFVDPMRGPAVLQIAALGGLFIVATALVFGSVAATAGALQRRLARSDRALAAMRRVAGLIFVGLAMKLALARR